MALCIEQKTRRQVKRHTHTQLLVLYVLYSYILYDFVFSDEIVALKRLKMEKEKEGFPITSLREINTILKAQHPNIVTVRVRWSDNGMFIGYCF